MFSFLKMGELFLTQELVEKILSFADGETLLACEKISPVFEAAVLYLTSKNIWKRCCNEEIIKENIIFQIITKLFPHTKEFRSPKNWRLTYEFWFSLNKIPKNIVQSNFKILKLSKKYSQICNIYIHGSLILVLLKYNKNFSIFYKIKTVNTMHEVIYTSCKFNADSLYVTPVDEANTIDGAVLLYCDMCNLIAIPAKSNSSFKHYPKIHVDINVITVKNSNDLLFFKNKKGLFGNSDCFCIKNEVYDKEIDFISITLKNTYLYIIVDDICYQYNTFQTLHAKVTCARVYVNLILLGTDTGMLYAYFCKDKTDISKLRLTNHNWCFNVSKDSILSIDVMYADNKIEVICSNYENIYQITMYP